MVVSWQQNSPGYIACNLQVDGIIHRFYCLIKISNRGGFFSKPTAKPRIIQFRIHNLTVLITVLFPSIFGPCFWLQAGPPLSLFTIKMAKLWPNRGALQSVHWRVPTNFILYVSTLMLVLLSYHWFVSRSGPTFDKIAFNFRYVTLFTFRSLVGGTLENS